MNKNYLKCHYLIEGNYKVSKGEKVGIYNVNEIFENEDLLLARETALSRFNELVFKILDDNSILYKSVEDAYSKMKISFVNPVIVKLSESPKRNLIYTSEKQFLTLSFVVDCTVNIGEPKREISSTIKYIIFGISTSLFITDYIEALLSEKAIYKYIGQDTGNEICTKKLSLDLDTVVEVEILKTEVEGILL